MNSETLERTNESDCNTKIKSLSQPNQLKYWFFTFNNYSKADIQILEQRFREICNMYVFQEEKGENGTEHLQGVIYLKKAMRWTEFDLSKKIHWEACKNFSKAVTYCSKKETRNGEVFFFGLTLPKPLKVIDILRPWQKDIEQKIKEEPDDRKIIWIYDNGNTGKSTFCKYLIHKYNACYITEGKKADIINIVFNRIQKSHDLGLVILDIPRSNKNVSYKSIEEIKNGIICNTKYETGTFIINPPHIVVFCNFYPELDNFTLDRWDIFTIDDNYNLIKKEYAENDL